MLLDSSIPLMWIHTFFTRFPIDIVFLDRSQTVTRITTALTPWRFSPIAIGARHAIELPVGSVQRSATELGDRLTIEPAR